MHQEPYLNNLSETENQHKLLTYSDSTVESEKSYNCMFLYFSGSVFLNMKEETHSVCFY